MSLILVGVAAAIIVMAWVWFKFFKAARTIDHLMKTNAELEQTNQRQAAEIAVKNTQIQHHQTRKQNEENLSGVSRERIIDQLHENGDLRSDE